MRVIRLKIENFRSIRLAEFLLDGHTLLVATNNVGKSTGKVVRRGQRIPDARSDEWLRDGAYARARVALDTALAQEQLPDGIAEPPGIRVMNVHKAKGKQFDGVIFVREIRQAEDGATSSFVWRGDTTPVCRAAAWSGWASPGRVAVC